MQPLASQGRVFIEWLAGTMGVVLKKKQGKQAEDEKMEQQLKS